MNTQVHVNRYTHVSGTLNHNDKMLRKQVMHLYRYLISLLNLYMHTHIPESFIHIHEKIKDIVEVLNVMIKTKEKISKINKQAIFTCIYMNKVEIFCHNS